MPLTEEENALLSACPLFRGMERDVPRCLAEEAERAEFQPGQTVYSPRHFRRSLGVVLS